jgi:hypothetical protein
MPKVKIELGATLDTVGGDELRDILNGQRAIEEERAQARARGIAVLRLPQLQGFASAGILQLGQGSSAGVGPRDGFIWLIKRIFVNGLATGDVVNIYADSFMSQPLWQFTFATPQATYGKFSMFLREGQTLYAQNIGTFTSTAQITISGDLLEIPTIMLGKLA